MGAPSRAAAVALLVVLACLTSVLAAPLASARPGDGATRPADPAASAGSAESAGQSRRQTRDRTDDFPWLPERCYDSRDVAQVPCRLTRFPGRPTLVLWGDSHANMYLPPLRRAAERRRFNLVAVVFGGCPVSVPYPVATSPHPRTACDKHNEKSLAFVRSLAKRPAKVRLVIGGFWSGYRQGYALMERERRTGIPSGLLPYNEHMARLAVKRSGLMMRRIARLGVQVDLIGQAATVPIPVPRCARGQEPYQCNLPRRAALPREHDTKRWMRRQLLSRLPAGSRLVDTTARYCSRTTCFAHVDGVDTFFDTIHLGRRLTAKMGPAFRPVVRALLTR